MSYLTLNDIQDKVILLAKIINAPKELIPTFGHSIDGAHPHIEIDNNGYHFVIVERGVERNRKTTNKLSDLLYWIFEGITFSMASKHELNNRIPGQDPRKLMFEKQVELLNLVDKKFGEKRQFEINQIIKLSPYNKI